MNFRCIIILALLNIPAVAQDVESIVFTSQQDNEPPIVGGRPKFTIEFTRRTGGDFVASGFYENGKRTRFKNRAVIEKARVKKVVDWKKSDKRTFNQTDLDLNIDSLRARMSQAKLNFDLPVELIVDVDSFQFCRDFNGYGKRRSLMTGGEYFTVALLYGDGARDEYIFDWGGFIWENLNLRDFILCYTLLVGGIPHAVHGYQFFSKESLMDKIMYYESTVECEEFYYKECVEKNPGMTSSEKRQRKGWNFPAYLKQRNSEK